MKNWKFTNIHHAFRRQAGISLNEYAVLDIIYQSQTCPSSKTESGYSIDSYSKIADFLGLSKGAVHGIIERMIRFGLVEVNLENPIEKRTTSLWYDNAYTDSEKDVLEGAKTIAVQKMNVQKMNGTVHFLNDFRSENERHTILYKRKKEQQQQPNGLQPDDVEVGLELNQEDATVLLETTSAINSNELRSRLRPFISQLITDGVFIDFTCLQNKILERQRFWTYLKGFLMQKEAAGDLEHGTYKAFKHHFSNWLPKHISGTKNQVTPPTAEPAQINQYRTTPKQKAIPGSVVPYSVTTINTPNNFKSLRK